MGDFKWLMILGVLSLIGITFVISYIREKKRSEVLSLVAKTLGLSFEKVSNINVENTFGAFPLFSKGHAKHIKNRMWGERNGIDIMLFGYRYTEGSGRNSTTHEQTVLFLKSSKMHLPAFSLRPENFIHKVGQIFGYKDIDFETHPGFSKSYLLRGQDEPRIRQIFSFDVLSFLEQHKGMCMEGQDNVLICYRQSKRSKPDDVRTFVQEGESLQRALSAG